MTSKGIKRLRAILWHSNPHCCYCGTLTIPVEQLTLLPGEPSPMNMATLDHVFSINNAKRDREEYVLACHECNSLKSLVESHDGTLVAQREKAIKKLMIINRMIEFEKE